MYNIRNTFLELALPPHLSLCRAATEPLPKSAATGFSCHSESAREAPDAADACDVHKLLESLSAGTDESYMASHKWPVPSPLSLEFFETDDNYIFQPTHKVSPLQAPTPLLLEYIGTADPFQSTPKACNAPELSSRVWEQPGMPPQLPLECLVTDDPFQPTPTGISLTWQPLALQMEALGRMDLQDAKTESPGSSQCDGSMPWTVEAKNTFEALGELTLQRAKTDPMPMLTEDSCGESTEGDSAMETLPLPPMLELESMQTADPFEHSSNSSVLTEQPMYVALPIVSKPVMCPPPPPMVLPPMIEPTPPTRPPTMPAPSMDAPEAPRAPKAPPSRTPGASAASLEKKGAVLCKPGVLVRTADCCTHVHWAVDARRLDRQDKQAVSPVFSVMLPEHGPTPFKIVLYAKAGAVDGKKGAGFVKVRGCGRIVLKCEAQLPETCPDIAFRMGVGRDEVMQPFRGPAVHNFREHSCHGLPTVDEEWNFTTSVDENNTFLVSLEIAPKPAYVNNPNVWWAPVDMIG